MAQPANLPAAQAVIDPQASDQLTQAMLAKGSIAVDTPGNKMPSGIPQTPGGGGIPLIAAGAGGSASNQYFQGAQKQVAQQAKGQLGVAMGQDLLDAYANESEAMYQNRNATSQKFGLGSRVGIAEALFDAVRAPFTRKKLGEAREDRMLAEQDFRQRKLNAEVDKENQRRKEYVENVMPMLKEKFPGMDEKALTSSAVQMAAQNMPIEKVFPEGVPNAVRETYLGAGGETMVRFRNPETGAIKTGEAWKPYVQEGPTGKTTTNPSKWTKTYDNDGNEFETQYGAPDENGSPQILQQIPTGKNVESKPISAMTSENRKYGAMVANATSLVAQSLPILFDKEGGWKGIKAMVPMSEEKAAHLAYKNAIRQSIRPESGAAVPPEEVQAAEDMYLPDFNDSDLIAQSKVQRFAEYQKRMYTGMFEGFRDIPPELGFTDYMQPWMGTPAAQAAKQVNAQEDEQVQVMGAYQEWLRQQQGN